MGKIKSTKKSDFDNVVRLIEDARARAFSKVNAELVSLYFQVGQLVSERVANGSWGEGTVDELANYIDEKMPGTGGFTRRGLYRMKQFYEAYSVSQFVEPLAAHLQSYFYDNKNVSIVSALPTQLKTKKRKGPKVSALPAQIRSSSSLHQQLVSLVLSQISWASHLEILSGTKSPEEKFFYLLHCIKEKWSMRELRRQLSTGYFERTMISKSVMLPVQTRLQEDFSKDPFIFEFLNLPDGHSENDLEKALIANLQKFILEIGKGFTYMGNQFRLQVGKKDYHTDLLFYNRNLQCMVLFELKIREFEPEFLGKLNFYLEALDRDIKRPHENPSIGVLLCKGKDTEVVEYAMARNTSPAMIAAYETKLINKKVLAKKLHQLASQLSGIDKK